MPGMELLANYDFALCSNENRLKQSLELRLEVFHFEQKFPSESEIDEYDPISAHFVITRREDTKVVATVRLTPYPRKEWLTRVQNSNEQEDDGDDKISKQNQTSIVTSGGGPGGTSGGLPMFSGAKDEKHDNVSALKTSSSLPESSDDASAKVQFPLGRPIPPFELSEMFIKAAKSQSEIEEEHGAPKVRGAKISRLAVSRSERGKGLGVLIMQQVEGWLMVKYVKAEQTSQQESHQSGTSTPPPPFNVVISSQQHAVPFYEKLGYSVYGQPYDEEGAPHNWCVKTLVASSNNPNAGKSEPAIK